MSHRRATATVLFTDVVGSTRMRTELGDEDADAVRREHDARVRDAIALHGGQAVKTLGDGFLVVFESAGAAVACSVDIQRAIDRQAHRGPVAVAVRIGIGAGDVAWEDGDVFGTPVVEAQRLCALAGAGGVLATDAVRLLAGSAAAPYLEDAGELPLRGLDHPVRAWRVRWTPRRVVTVPLASALAADRVRVFAGRKRELSTLRRAWEDASAGRRRGVFVSGEPGIGKTRLAAELAAYVQRDGGVVLYGHCDDGLASAAQPFAEALSTYVAACPRDELRVQVGAHGGALLPVLPSLTERLPAVREPAPTTPDAERLRTCSATTSLLEAATAAAPVLLILDDLHWADELSLLLLQHVLRADGGSRLLLVATYRDSEESRSPLLAEVVTGLARRPDVERLELTPLGEAEVAALLVDAGATEALAERVRATTDGNPFFVGEVVQALGDGHAMDMALTPRVRDVVRWRLGRLPSAVSEVLTSAALVGPEFHVDVVADVAGGGTDQVLDALEAAERARLIRPAGGLDRFAFAHALVRQAIVEDLAAGRRIRLHARAAEALERVSETRAVAPAELAVHLDAAGGLADASKTLRYARQAGDEAAARLAFDIAAAHYDAARRAQSRVPGVTVEERLGLDLAHASALRMGGDARANQALRKVADDAARAGDAARLATALLLSVLGVSTEFLREDHEMVALLRRGLELLPAADSPARAELQAFLALKGLYSIPDAERRAMVDDAVAMARRVENPDALASALTAHSWSVMDPRLRRERLLLADELVRIGPSAFPHAECDGHILRFLALVEDGDLPGADAALAAARATARLPVSRWTVTQWEATRALLAGKLATAEELSLRLTDAARDAGLGVSDTPPAEIANDLVARSTWLLWCLRLVQGDLGDFEPSMVAGIPERPAWSYGTEAQILLARGDERGARAALRNGFRDGLLHTPRASFWTATMTGVADVCAALGDRACATPLYELLEPCADVMSPLTGPVSLSVGRLASTLGRRDEAERHFRGGVELCERMDALGFLAIARYELGRLLLPSTEGRTLLEHARHAAEELAMPGWLARIGAARTDPTEKYARQATTSQRS